MGLAAHRAIPRWLPISRAQEAWRLAYLRVPRHWSATRSGRAGAAGSSGLPIGRAQRAAGPPLQASQHGDRSLAKPSDVQAVLPVAGRPGRVLRSWFDPRVAELREGGEKIVHCAGLGDIDTDPLGDLDECAGQAVQFQGLAGQPVLQH